MTPEEVTEKMQSGGVSAGIVKNIEDLITRNLYLKERGFLAEVKFPPHIDRKPPIYVMPDIVTRLSNQSLGIRKLAPGPISENNEYVLKSILKITDSEIEQNAVEGTFY